MSACRIFRNCLMLYVNRQRALCVCTKNVHNKLRDEPTESFLEKSASSILASNLRKSEVMWKRFRQTEILRKFIFRSLKDVDSVNFILNLLTACDRFSYSSDFLYNIIKTYQNIVSEQCVEFSPSFDEKLEILNSVSSYKNYHLINLVCSVFKINEESDQFKPYIQKLVDQRKLSEAAFVIRALNLQTEYSTQMIVLPLLLEGIVNPAVIYLKDDYEAQLDIVRQIDNLINVNALGSASLEDRKSKKLLRILNTLINIFKISPETCKNLHFLRSQSAIYTLIKRRIGQSITEDMWEEMVTAIVEKNDELKKYLIRKLLAKNDVKTAIKMAGKFNVSEEFLMTEKIKVESNLKLENLQDEECELMEECEYESENDEINNGHLNFPLSLSALNLISEKEEFFTFIEEIKKYKMIGIDCEWKAKFGLSKDRLSLIQLAAHDKVFILDILALDECLEIEQWDLLMDVVFGNPNVIKLGCGIVSDVKMILQNRKGTEGKPLIFSHILDMAIFYQKLLEVYPEEMNPDSSDNSNPKGLSTLCEIILGKPLNKEQRLCDWEKRPLKESQLGYAALDAHCLLQMYDVLKKKCEEQNLNFNHLSQVAIISTTSQWKSKRKFKGLRNESDHSALTPIEQFKVVLQPSLESIGEKLKQYGADVVVLNSKSWLQDIIKLSKSEKRIVIVSDKNRNQLKHKIDKSSLFSVSQMDETSVYQILHYFNIELPEKNTYCCKICNSDKSIELSKEDIKILQECESIDNILDQKHISKPELQEFLKNELNFEIKQNITNNVQYMKEVAHLCTKCGHIE